MTEALLKDLEVKLTSYKAVNFITLNRDYLLICNLHSESFKQVIKDLKSDPNFSLNLLTDLSAVDYPDYEKRFEVIYNLLSLEKNIRLIIKVSVNDKEELESISDLYSASIWYEREVWDMFGIRFIGNPDLRRILTDYGFVGHPLRKDFPLTGYKEVRYDYEEKKVVYESVNLTQDFRTFDFLSPWEGPNYNLPGDEKAKDKTE